MNLDSMPNVEKEPVRLTQEEFDRIADASDEEMQTESFKAELARLGLEMNTGMADIIIDGEPFKMNTSFADFGTLLLERSEK